MSFCDYTLVVGINRGRKCTRPVVNGAYYCRYCVVKESVHPLLLTGGEISDELLEIFQEIDIKRSTLSTYQILTDDNYYY